MVAEAKIDKPSQGLPTQAQETLLHVRLAKLRERFLLSLLLGLAVILGLSFYGDLTDLAARLRSFRWVYLPLILGLTLYNYGLRFLKWEYYLQQLEIRGVSWLDSLIIFFAGFTMVLTPGKVGEFLKSYLLKRAVDVPISHSAPIIIAERLSDGLAMLLLASVGLVNYRYGWPILLVTFMASMALVALVEVRPLALRLLDWGLRGPLIGRFAGEVRSFYESSYRLLTLRNLLVAVGLGFLSWAGECVAFYLVLRGLGLAPSGLLLFQAFFILASSIILGTLSFLPGGLGAVETSVTGLLILLLRVGRDLAAMATLLIRLCTLWFGVATGLLGLAIFHHRYHVDRPKTIAHEG